MPRYRKVQVPYDFSHMQGIKQKATNEQAKQTPRHRQQYGGFLRGKGLKG